MTLLVIFDGKNTYYMINENKSSKFCDDFKIILRNDIIFMSR